MTMDLHAKDSVRRSRESTEPFGADSLLYWVGPVEVPLGDETRANGVLWTAVNGQRGGQTPERTPEAISDPAASRVIEAGDWEIDLAATPPTLFYRGDPAKAPTGYNDLIIDLATKVSEQQAEIEELAGDPDIAVPASTVYDPSLTRQVAEVAVVAVMSDWLAGTNADTVVLADKMAKHFAELLGHYSRRTANLLAERDGLMMRVQDAQEAEWSAAQNSGYWHQRATFAENLLQPFADCYEAVKNIAGASESMGSITCELDDTRAAYTILAEMRKDGGPGGNYEQFTRDRRQAKILDWAKRTFEAPGHDPVDLEERAFRFLEEALELWQSAMHRHLTEANGGQAFVVHGYDPETVHKPFMKHAMEKLDRVIFRVLSGDPGEIGREYGGVMITAACLAQVTGHSLAAEETREWTRVASVPRATFQQRHQAKRDAGI